MIIVIILLAAFENNTNVDIIALCMQAFINWDHLANVVDHNDNPRGTVTGYFVLVYTCIMYSYTLIVFVYNLCAFIIIM